MIRRFISVGVLALAAFSLVSCRTVSGPVAAATASSESPQYYELRIYSTQSADQLQRINDYWQNAAVPAYNRLGVHPVGVFTEIAPSATNHIYVLLPFDSLATFAAVPARLAADPVYQAAAASFLNARKANPAYERYESSLTIAFNGMKHLVVPPPDQKPNVFELRTYQSPGDERGLNKVQMFEQGEIQLMKDIGLAPIFYSRTLVGPHQPCLVYMTSGVNMDEHKRHWKAFGSAPIWRKLQADPQYKDNVTAIIRLLLQRTSASQI